MNLLRLAAAILFCLTLAAAGQEMKSEGSLTTNPIYQQNCAKCHGKTAEGRFMAGPSLVSGKATTMSADDLRNIIANGKHHMPKFGEKLSSADIDGLVDQIQAMNKKIRRNEKLCVLSVLCVLIWPRVTSILDFNLQTRHP